ncbi:hypothetical protein HG530_003738 [Fusarium avenaceum]|nr:hypothetical protein HG530_003738 [Fusarium avenaceum]
MFFLVRPLHLQLVLPTLEGFLDGFGGLAGCTANLLAHRRGSFIGLASEAFSVGGSGGISLLESGQDALGKRRLLAADELVYKLAHRFVLLECLSGGGSGGCSCCFGGERCLVGSSVGSLGCV